MMSDHIREAALAGLRRFLDSLVGEWVVFIYLVSRSRHDPSRVAWPREGAAREGAFELLRTILMPAMHGGEIRVRKAARPRGHPTVIQWPEAADLFSPLEASADVKPKTLERLASGEEREVKKRGTF